VIRRQLAALAARDIEASVLTGEAPSSGFDFPFLIEPSLGYDAPGSGGDVDSDRVRAIVRAVSREADRLGDDVVVHVHNPTIRKNASFLSALSSLAASGRRLLLQVHDLAEDWRPDVFSSLPYPDGARWAALNRFDVEAIGGAGAGPVAFLPNSIPLMDPQNLSGASRPRSSGPGLILYPVRAIRRKNIGEAVLLSLFARPGTYVGVTLPPTNPKFFPYFEFWRDAAAEFDAPIEFDIGLNRSLDDAYAEAKAVLTTSVKEGFGLSYLEAASRSRVTLGRRLPRVVSDFEASGVMFPGLYESIVVPLGSFDVKSFSRRSVAVVERACAVFGRPERGPELGSRVSESVLGGAVEGPDFGRLDEEAQRETLRSLVSDRRLRTEFIAANPFMEGWDAVADTLEPTSPEQLAPWSQALYGERLVAAYRDVLDQDGVAAPDKDKLLDCYLLPEYFHGVGI